jgi:lysophospholipase L1-like esterase
MPIKPVTGKINAQDINDNLSYLESVLKSVDKGSPKGAYATLAALQAAYPTGDNNVYVVTADGKWYFWSGSAWAAGGVYQASGTSQSIVKGKTFSSADSRFEEIEMDVKENQFPVKNLISNGDFSNGTTGWGITAASFSVVNGEMVLLATATGGFVSQTIPGGTVVGRKYYGRAKIKSTSNKVRLALGGTLSKYTSGLNVYEYLSAVHTATGTGHNINIQDGRSSGWDNVYIDNVLVVDLTATFGAGKEPSATEMDELLLSKFPDGWFSGTKSQLYNFADLRTEALRKSKNLASGLKLSGLGDSTLHGIGDETGEGYLPEVARILNISDYHKNSLPGSLIAGGDSAGTSFGARVRNTPADRNLLLIDGGINDDANNIPIGVLGVKDNQTFIGAYQIVIERAYAINPNMRIMILTPNRVWGNGSEKNSLRNYVNAAKQVAEFYGLPVLDIYNLLGLNQITKPNMLADDAHPNRETYLRKARLVAKFIETNY